MDGHKYEKTTSKFQTPKLNSSRKKIKCEHCDKTFYRGTLFAKHLSIHTGEKPFKCDICDTYFTESCSLKTHLLRIHTIKDPANYLTCGICGNHSKTLTN